jgi:hypothetical protein
MDFIAGQVIAEKCDVVLFAGDCFKDANSQFIDTPARCFYTLKLPGAAKVIPVLWSSFYTT